MPYYYRKKNTSTKSSAVERLDRVFSKYIRLRDAMAGGAFRCISCGRMLPIAKADCGHFFSRRHMSTRFDEDNCHAECARCNRFDAEHLFGYQLNLIRKIGKQRFDLLAVKANTTKKWSDFELEALIKHYKAKVAELEKEKGITL